MLGSCSAYCTLGVPNATCWKSRWPFFSSLLHIAGAGQLFAYSGTALMDALQDITIHNVSHSAAATLALAGFLGSILAASEDVIVYNLVS